MHTKESVEQDIANAVFLKSGMILDGDRLGNEYVGLHVDKRVKQTQTRGRYYSSRGPMKIVVEVGRFGGDSPRSFKERKNGTFNIAKIVERLIEVHNGKIARRERIRVEDNSRTNAAVMRLLALSLLGGERSEYSQTVSVTRYNMLESKIVVKATSENAEKLAKVLAYAEELGIAV